MNRVVEGWAAIQRATRSAGSAFMISDKTLVSSRIIWKAWAAPAWVRAAGAGGLRPQGAQTDSAPLPRDCEALSLLRQELSAGYFWPHPPWNAGDALPGHAGAPLFFHRVCGS